MDWLIAFEDFAKSSGVGHWAFALLFKFIILIALFAFARLLAMAIVAILPNGKLKAFLMRKAPD